MVCKMLVFDFKEAEKLFFEKNKLENFDVKLLPYSLNKKTINTLLPEDLEHTAIINVCNLSILSSDVINKFKNLRVIAFRAKEFKNIDFEACLKRNIAVVNVDVLGDDCEYKIMQKSIRAITSVFCGCKDYRVL